MTLVLAGSTGSLSNLQKFKLEEFSYKSASSASSESSSSASSDNLSVNATNIRKKSSKQQRQINNSSVTEPSNSSTIKKDNKTIKIEIIDTITNQVIRQQLIYGNVGQKVEYNTNQLMKVLNRMGYEEVSSNWAGQTKIRHNQKYQIRVKRRVVNKSLKEETNNREKIVDPFKITDSSDKVITDQVSNQFIKNTRLVSNTPMVVLAQKLNTAGAGGNNISDLEKNFFTLAETTSFGIR
ncbi:hypothetical protein JOC59_000183 [Weissella beninensis]|uniref:Mucin binding domain-containing protein n=1 Tax=Periweissella beninensis TaxID=504936 RepID=A0ABT0VF35_9LACO|nr:hypothetical protein [Periweissella beninensis]MBM7543485.1 hypothetical protein [Periweissella beninensis]MCM2436467.1 hypothetical protein [Periweissella beninensis]